MAPDPVKTPELLMRFDLGMGAGDSRNAETSIRRRNVLKRRTLFRLILPVALFTSQAMASTYTVTNLRDSGTGSLRAAILAANTNQGGVVAFGTKGTINLATALPNITSQMTIDGTTTANFSGTPVVSVNFNASPGLIFAAGSDRSTIKALSLVRALNAAVTLQAPKI